MATPENCKCHTSKINSEYTCPSAQDFFTDKTLALTGGTGFLGQGIVEKLLRCCPNIKKIILLMRTKKGAKPEERLKSLIQLPVFDQLREINPKFAEKLSFVSGDLEAEDLGLNQKSRRLLQDEVHLFIHSAACLKFNEHLRLSFEINVQSVRRLVKFCKTMPRLEAFLHISTAYAHCDQGKIDEVFYEQSIDYRDLESALRCMDHDAVANITPNILGKKPNTYTLTKALAEDVISRESENLPVCIVRPSMVIPAWKEPMPGWCTNMYGPTAFLVAYAKGALRSVIADEEIVADLIPVDLVINAVICALMKTAIDVSRSNRFAIGDDAKSVDVDFLEESSEATDGTLVTVRSRIPIYNVTTGNGNPLYIHKLVKLCQHWYHHYPLDPLRLPEVTVTSNKFLHKASLVLRQTIPAYLYDVTLMLRRHQGIKMSDLNEKLIAGMEVMEFFFTNQFRWGEDNARNLLKSISPVDQKVFNFDSRSFAWEEHIKHYVMGTRKYLVKESMDDYPRARKSVERLRILNRCVDSVTAVFLLGLFTASGATGYAVDAISYISGYATGLL